MTQVINGYLAWPFPNVDVAVITSRGDPHDLVAGVLSAARALVEVVRLPRRRSVVVAHLSERGSFVREGALLRIARLRGIATVAHLHGASFAEFSQRFPGLVRFALRSADRVISLSAESSDIAGRFVSPEHVVLIPNAIASSAPRPKQDVIVFGGSVSERKGVDVLVEAWRGLQDHHGWRLLVAGPIRDEHVVDRTVPDIEFLGALPHHELMSLLDSSRIAVLPSREEAMPMFILEAMARGNCVVATAVGGVAPVLSEGRGIVLPAGDAGALGAAIGSMLQDAVARQRFATAALTAFRSTYSAEAVFPRVEALWLDALGARAASAIERTPSDRSIRVLHSLAPPDGTTKYVNQITDGAAPEVDVRYFSWRAALRSDYDVLHLHWPELLLRGRTLRKRLMKRTMMRLLLVRMRLRRRPLVRTLHNVQPHEGGGRAERRLLAAVDRRTDLFIRLNPTTDPPAHGDTRTILHGHYRDRFSGHQRSEVVPGRVLYFGIIRPYKGVERVIEVVPRLADDGVTLRVVGKPSAAMHAAIRSAIDREPSVTGILEFVSDEVLVAEVTAAELVVLPYREMHNSGALLVALSLDRPVLVPRSATTSALADEVGPGWISEYDGELEAADVERALAGVRAGLTGRPRLDGRDWSTIGTEHRDAYVAVLSERRRA